MQVRQIMITGALVAFFVSTLGLVFGVSGFVNSPDEQANALFAEQFSETGMLRIAEPANPAVGGVLGPRSMLAVNDVLVPQSFLGLPVLAGLLGHFTQRAAFLLTPLLAVFAVLAFYGFILALFHDKRLAMVSAFFLAVHPAFWYYASRTMMHNIGFVAFLIFSAWMFMRDVTGGTIFTPSVLAKLRAVWSPKSQATRDVLAGVALGLALAFRTSEVIWISLVSFGLIVAFVRTKELAFRVALFGVGAIVVLLPFAYLNVQTYGGPFVTGYTRDVPFEQAVAVYEGADRAPVLAPTSHSLTGAFSFLFPFGIHEYATLRHVYGYAIKLYPWMAVFALLGIALVLRKREVKTNSWRSYGMVTLFIAGWLFVMYGSWTFFDNPDPHVVTLGNSYVRYWLPVFVLLAPFAARGALFVVDKLPERRRIIGTAVLLSSVALLSANLVFFGTDGIIPTRLALDTFVTKRDAIFAATEPDAIIIVDRADKYLYPDRRVVVPLRDALTYTAMPALLQTAPLYYFGITFPEKDLDYLNNVKLKERDLFIEPLLTINEETLYRITMRNAMTDL